LRCACRRCLTRRLVSPRRRWRSLLLIVRTRSGLLLIVRIGSGLLLIVLTGSALLVGLSRAWGAIALILLQVLHVIPVPAVTRISLSSGLSLTVLLPVSLTVLLAIGLTICLRAILLPVRLAISLRSILLTVAGISRSLAGSPVPIIILAERHTANDHDNRDKRQCGNTSLHCTTPHVSRPRRRYPSARKR